MPQVETDEIFVSNWTLATGSRRGHRQVIDPGPGPSSAASSASSSDVASLQATQTAAGENVQR